VAARSKSDAAGAQAADRRVVPVLAGDGVGPAIWRAVRPVLDEAVRRSSGSKHGVEWRELPCGDGAIPEETVRAVGDAKVALRGPIASGAGGWPVRALRRTLDLHVIRLRFTSFAIAGRSGSPLHATLFHDASEGLHGAQELAPYDPRGQDWLARLARDEPSESARIRFGTRERVDAWQRSTGRRRPPLVEVGLAFQPVSRIAVERLAAAAIAHARAEHAESARIVTDPCWPAAESQLVGWVYRLAELELRGEVLTAWDVGREQAREGPEAAAELRRDKREAGAVFVEDVPLAAVLAGPYAEGLQVYMASSSCADTLAAALAVRVGGAAMVPEVSLNPETGVAVFETLHGTAPGLPVDAANPTGMLLAGAALLRQVGCGEAGEKVERATAFALEKGPVTADVAAPGTRSAGCAEFAEAVRGAL